MQRYKKITIFGCPGSGKSTLAKQLSVKLGIPVYHLDLYFWLPGWVLKDEQERARLFKEMITQDSWIIDGTFGSTTYQQRIEGADLLIYLDFPRWLCLWRCFKRMFQKKRICTPEGCDESISGRFLKYIWRFRKDKHPEIQQIVEKYKDKSVVLHSPKEVAEFMCKP
jgi:adenylate kinase family enzyme